MAWHDLVAHLDALTSMTVAVPFGKRLMIRVLARPAALQLLVLALVGMAPSLRPVADRMQHSD